MQFEIVDRRAEKAAAEAAAPAVLPEPETVFETEEVKVTERPSGKVAEFKKTVRGEVQTFRSVGYTLVYLNLGGQQMLAGRAVGLRTDDKVFIADWLLPPIWEEGTNWQTEALARLKTFKGCSCGPDGRCKFHGEVAPGQFGPGKWVEEDMQRLKKVQTTPLCEALEVLMRAEAARQNQRIVTPGR